MNNRTIILAALTSLLIRESDDSFVIIEHPQTRKFVQFAGSVSEQLLLDLPSQTLSEIEFYRAANLFQKMGITGSEHELLDEPGGRIVGQQFSFNITFQSVAEAAKVVEDIFTIVYRLPADCSLEIIEN